MENSILTSIKKLIGMDEDYEYYDTDIIIHINTIFMYLSQIGIGPSDGFSISDETTTWEDFLPSDNKNFEAVKIYIYLKTRLIFDPPQSSSTMEAIKQTISELEWRLNVEAEQKRKEVKYNAIWLYN